MKKFAREDGNVLIEMCLIVPIFSLLLISAVDLGLLLQEALTVADSARAGAEYATTSSTAADISGMQQTATNSAANIAGYKAVATSFCTCGPGGSGISCTGTCPSGSSPAQYAQVTATASLPIIFKVQWASGTIPVKSVVRVRTAWTGGK